MLTVQLFTPGFLALTSLAPQVLEQTLPHSSSVETSQAGGNVQIDKEKEKGSNQNKYNL